MGNSQKLQGILTMCIGVACLSTNDALAKALSEHYSPLQILFLRNLIALPIALGLVLRIHGSDGLRSATPWLHFFRGAVWVLATYLFFTSIGKVGLAKSTALLLIMPLIIVAFGAIFFKEKSTRNQNLAVIFGFIGALIIIRPSAPTFEPILTLPILAAVSGAVLLLSARWLDKSESVWTVLFYLTATGTVFGFLTVPFVWSPVLAKDYWLFIAISVFGTVGMTLITQAFRFSPATIIAPLDYTALIWATVYGWIFWQEKPVLFTYIGASIIVCSGIFITSISKQKVP